MLDSNPSRHQIELKNNVSSWQRKPRLREVYADFYKKIGEHIVNYPDGQIVEIGSGAANLKNHIPDCICTDFYDNPWVDQTENAYALSFDQDSLSNLILFDVFHHLEYPMAAFHEFKRTLKVGGVVIIFEPYISALGSLVYGPMHKEDLGMFNKIELELDQKSAITGGRYYAAQGNATRFFSKNSKYMHNLKDWKLNSVSRIASLPYLATGGFSGPQLLPNRWFPMLSRISHLADCLPRIFATRMLVVLQRIV